MKTIHVPGGILHMAESKARIFFTFQFKKMEQELINIIEELRVISHQVAHTYTREIAHKDMDADQWALMQEALKQINLKSQEAFLMVANLRRSIPA